MPRTKKITKSNAGRPTQYTEDNVNKLIAVYKLGVTDETATKYTGISRTTLHNWKKQYPEFLNKIRQAKEFVRIASGQVVVNSIITDNDVNSAKWWLEKKHSKEFTSGGGMNVGINAGDGKIEVVIVDYSSDKKAINGELNGVESPDE